MSCPWYVYIIQTKNNKLYTGITTDLERRFYEHLEGKGAKFTRSNPPQDLVYMEMHADRSSALKREAAIKKLKRQQKLTLIKNQ
jgi:putative endonuclease